MKLMNRFLAFSLGLLLTLHSFYLPAWASELDEEEDLAEIVEDILIDPAELPLEAGIAPASLGLTLTVGQIAALIAGGIGTVYAATNWDALGSHLQTALNDAASSVNGGTEALLNWWNAAITGDIKLSSAPAWIAKTILDTCYNIHQGLSYPTASPFGSYDIPTSGTIMQSGVTYPIGLHANFNTGEVSGSSEIKTTQPCYVFRTYDTSYSSDGKTFNLKSTYWLFSVTNSQPYIYYKALGASSGSSRLLVNQYVGSDGLVYRYGSYSGKAMSATVSNEIQMQVAQHFLDKYYKPGAIESSSFDAAAMCGSLYGSVPYSPTFNDVPVGESVCPDVLVGGISQAWTDQGVGTDVIDLPDILIDGSGIISADEAGSIDVSLGDALDDVATGELTWDDLWLDISGTKPEITVKDDAAEDVGGPITPPDWFVDFCDRLTGSADDRNDKIDSLLPGLGDGMASIDDFESDILDQFNNAFNDLDLDGFQLSSGILAALTWLVYWVVQFFNASGDLQVLILLPMLLGLALLFIGRGSMAMQRVEASHLKASLKKDGGGSS